MTTNPHTLFITNSEPFDGDTYQHKFVIDEEKQKIDESELDELIFELRRADIVDSSDVPLYDLLSNQLWTNTRNRFGQEPRKMPILILLYKRMEDSIESNDINKVVCDDIHENEHMLIRDICDQKSVTLTGRTDTLSLRFDQLKIAFESFLSAALLIIDQIFSLLFGHFFTSETESDIGVMFPVVRPRTFAPIYDRLDIEFDTIYTLRGLSYVFKYRSVIPQSANIRLLQKNISIGVIFSELKALLSIYYHTLFTKSDCRNISDWVWENENVHIERLIQRIYFRTSLLNLDTVFVYIIASHFFNEDHYDKILVPGIARTSKGLSYAASRQGVGVYHLHHGIGARGLINETVDQTRFTAGELNKRYIENSKNTSICPIATGLLKHQFILDKLSELSTNTIQETAPTVLLATQPYTDKVREEFIDDVVSVLLTHTDYDIVIKPHPGEESIYYEELIEQKFDKNSRRQVTVDEGELYKKLYTADLTVTISSNVAVESIILETPAISYNTWTPDIGTPLYVEYGSIPDCSSPQQLRSFLTGYDTDDLIQKQERMLDDDYMVHGNSIEQITTKIQSELTD
jgi:hypothetical protein